MNNTMIVEAKLSSGALDAQYDDPVEVGIYDEPTKKKVTDNEGDEVVLSGKAICRDDVDIPIGSKLTINNQNYEAVEVNTYYPMGKFSHAEVSYK